MDGMDDDLQMQLALALSIAEAQGQATPEATQLGAALAAAFATPAAPSRDQGEGNPQASQLGAALAAALGAPSGIPAGSTAVQPRPPASSEHHGVPPPVPTMTASQTALAAALQQAIQGANLNPTTTPPQPAPSVALGAPAPGNPTGMNSLSTALQQAMQGVLQHGWGSSSMQAQAASRTVAVPTSDALPLEKPEWLKPLLSWWQKEAASSSNPVTQVVLSASEMQEGLQLLCKALGEQVVLAGMPSALAGSLVLRCTSSGTGISVTQQDAETLLSLWVLRPRQAAKQKLRALHDAHQAMQQSMTQASTPNKALGYLVCTAASRLAFDTLRDDEGDLYYENGQATAALIQDLKQGTLQPSFLDAMVSGCSSEQDGAIWTRLLRAVLADLSALNSLSSGVMELEERLRMLDAFTTPARLQACLIAALAQETFTAESVRLSAGAGTRAPKSMESAAVLAPLLQVSCLADPISIMRGPPSTTNFVSKGKDALLGLRGYPGNPGESDVVLRMMSSTVRRLQEAGHLLLDRLIRGKDKGSSRELVLSWMSLVALLNEERTLLGEAGKLGNHSHLTAGCSDGFMVNVTAVMLRFCCPFVTGYLDTGLSGGKFSDLMERHLDPSYYSNNLHRVGNLSKTISLAGERGMMTAEATAIKVLRPELDGSTPSSFIADCFFLTQRLVWVGIMPTISRYRVMMEVMQQASRQAGREEAEEQRGRHRGAAVPPLLPTLLWDCTRAQLMEPTLSEDLVQFSMLTLDWLRQLVLKGSKDAFQIIPEYVLSSALTWLEFVIRSGQAVVVASKPIGLIMASIVTLLDNPACVRSPLLHDKAVKLLLVMLGPQLDVTRRTTGGGLGRTVMMPGEAALVSAVLRTAAIQEGLLPALMRTYVAADFVVGLDVDKDAFDKFSMRSCIDMILEELWKDEPCRRSIVKLAAGAATTSSMETGSSSRSSNSAAPPATTTTSLSSATAFKDYISCILNSLMYLFKDSLDRLHDIHEIESSKADRSSSWSQLSSEERQQKEAFYQSQQHTAKGFLRMAVATLQWLNTLAEHAGVLPAFLQEDTAGRAAYACVHFLELLVGPTCQKLKVDRPEQYGFDLPGLMESLLSLMMRLARAPAFISILVAEPDLDMGILRQVLALLEANQQARIAQSLRQTIDALLTAGAGPGTGSTSSSAGGVQPIKVRRSAEARDVGEGMDVSDGEGSQQQQRGVLPELQNDQQDPQQQQLPCLALPELPGASSAEEMVSEYKRELQELGIGDFDSSLPRSYNRQFADKAQEVAGETPAKVKRLTKEVRDLHSRTPLPCDAAAAIFLRHDSDRMDKMRIIITGPEGTPYEGGCFVFDLFFPSGYPNVPPLMSLQTTGEGRVRFNPNLYADGKVCLSLLGTWHGGHESEKWNPTNSTVFQIVMSIQSQIMVEDPYFNEPNVEAMRTTPEGLAHSASYNAELQLGNLRWAMIDVLKNPPPGFEGVVRGHFRVLRHRLLATARRWVQQAGAAGEAMQRRMDAAVCELHQLLQSL